MLGQGTVQPSSINEAKREREMKTLHTVNPGKTLDNDGATS